MRGWKKVNGCGPVLTHTKWVYTPRHFSRSTSSTVCIPRKISTRRFAMASTEKAHIWTALNVRNAFLDYFKEKGHTFGRYPQATYIGSQLLTL